VSKGSPGWGRTLFYWLLFPPYIDEVSRLLSRFTLSQALVPLVTAAVLLLGSVVVYPVKYYWPLGIGALVAAVMAARAGFRWGEIGRAALRGMRSTLIALSILLLVGGLIGVWVSAGTVPAMVYYGLSLANPRFLVPAAFLLALVTSMMLGTSIGTLSTLGTAMMGVAHGIGAPLPLVAGALVSGALFGDRSSPLSGSLNLNAAMTGNELRTVMKALLPTGLVGAGLSLAGYALLGARLATGSGAADSPMRAALAAEMHISPWLLLPPALVLAMAFLRVPVRWALAAGIAAGAAMGVVVEHQTLWVPIHAAVFGHAVQVAEPGLAKVLSGGGILPMVHQFLLILTAGAFSGIMESSGMMATVVERVIAGAKRPLAMVGATMAISTAVALVASNQALAIIVPGRMLRPAYDRERLPATLLSRSLADSGTVLSGIIPWNLMGMLASAAVGVPVTTLAPYACFAWILPLLSFGWTLAGESHLRQPKDALAGVPESDGLPQSTAS